MDMHFEIDERDLDDTATMQLRAEVHLSVVASAESME